ncbi:MAG: long-chain-fatty-acid--CoA ligase [Clostridia bacterium]|nr:long-chain-fatty-acid--CoA ligase [Clostridia bacterium]
MPTILDYKSLKLNTVGGCLAESTERNPNGLAVVDNIRRLTYSELLVEAQAFAAGLLRLGVQKGDRVAVCLPNWHEFIISYFAIGLVGAVIIPLNIRYKPREVEYVLDNAGVAAVITAQTFGSYGLMDMYLELKPALSNFTNLIVVRATGAIPQGVAVFEEVIRTNQGAPLPTPLIKPEEDLFAILYTSGTTGAPKGAMLTHRNLVHTSVTGAEIIESSPKDVYLIPVPIFHIFGMGPSILTAISSGAGLVLLEGYKPEAALELIQREKVTVHHGVPTMFIMELNHPDFDKYDLSSLRTGIIGGAPCPIETVKAIRTRMGCNICISYGLTETSPILTATRLDDDDIDIAETVGRAAPGVEIKIVDNQGQTLGSNEVGEIVARSRGVMKGYFGKPVETAEALSADGWFSTGDLGTIDDRGFIRIVGRKKEMIIRGGYNIYPREVEEVLYLHPVVLEVAVIGIPDPVMGERTYACIKLKPGAAANEAEIQAFSKTQLANYKVPDRVVFIQEFPTTASGKIRKLDLKELVAN